MSSPSTSVQESRIGHADYKTCSKCSYDWCPPFTRVQWSGYAWVDHPCYRLVKCRDCQLWEFHKMQQAEATRKKQLLADVYVLNPWLHSLHRDDPPSHAHPPPLVPPKQVAPQLSRTTTVTHVPSNAPIPVGLPSPPPEPKLSLHPKRAAIVRFDARIGKASPLQVNAAASASASRKESSATVTQATDVRDICSAPTGKCFFTLLRPSGEASPLDPITRHLVRLWAFT